MMAPLHPALPLVLGAGAVLVLPARLRWVALLAGPLAALWLLEQVPSAAEPSVFLGQQLMLLRGDALSLLFARVFTLAGVLGLLYGLKETSRLGHAASMLTLAGALGVVLAGDLLTLFLAWELKAVATAAVIFSAAKPRAVGAAYRYLLVHAAGGGVLLTGVVLRAATAGLEFGPIGLDSSTAWLLGGFALCAAVPPLHAWMTDAYPEASPAGAVLLSAFTTKAAVYALARGFPGLEPLVWAGAAMALYGAAYAVLENDLRRILAYHIVSQVGFMVCGIGMAKLAPGGDAASLKTAALALNGATAHAVCHILYKGLLFMATGAVLHATGRRRLSELGGLWRSMPLTLGLCLVGSFSIAGVPLFSGFVSKSMVLSAAEYGHRGAVELMLMGASVGTFLSLGLKLPWFVFFNAKTAAAPPERPVPWNMTLAMAIAAALCVAIGLAPQTLLYGMLPEKASYEPFTAAHVLTSLQLLTATALGFFLLLPKLSVGSATVLRDAQGLYRLLASGVLVLSRRALVPLFAAAGRAVDGLAARVAAAERPLASLARSPVGTWVWFAVLTLALLVVLLRR